MAEVSENNEIITNWLSALRDDSYRQHRGMSPSNTLRYTSEKGELTYNAFGVFCDLYDPSGWRKDGVNSWYYYTSIKRMTLNGRYALNQKWWNYIPEQILKELGMPLTQEMRAGLLMSSFFELSFSDVADHLEKILL